METIETRKNAPGYSTKIGFLHCGRPGLVLRLRLYRGGSWVADIGNKRVQEAVGGSRNVRLKDEEDAVRFLAKLKDMIMEDPDLLDDTEERKAQLKRKRERQAELASKAG